MNDTNCYVMEFTLAFGLLLVLVKDTTSGQQLDCACYGNDVTIDSVMPNCTSSNGIIIIDSVFRAAKLQSTGCPAVANSTTRDEANCCSYDNGTDCRIDLTPSEVPTVFAECAGTATCSQQVTWQSTSSSQCMGTHMNETNYMCINYTCIPEADVLEFCNSSATEITATTSYFINDGYPSNISHSNCCACVVTASAASATIDLDILDLQLYEANSTCFQTVFVRDNSSVTTYNCTDNINYTIRNLLTSNGSTLTVTLKSGAAAQGNGKAWFRATVSNGGMTTTCNSVSVCPDEITTSTSSTPATTTGGTNSVTSGTGTTNNKSNEEAWLFGLSVTVSIMCIAGLFVILLLLFLLFCVLCYTWGKSKSFRVAEDRSDSTLGLYSDKSNSSPESFNPYTIFVRENSTRTGIQSDSANKNGGKWIIRLKKGLASRCWENLILAMLGEQFMVGEEICGAVISIRYAEDILSLWNRTANDHTTTSRIRDTLKRVLNLPPNTIMEYKTHNDSLKDNSSFRNTDVFMR